MLASLALMPDPRSSSAAAAGAARAARRARGRFAEARLLGALDWFGILTFGLARDRAVGVLDRRVRERHVAARRAMLRDSETGYRPSFHLRAMLAALALTLLWIMLVRPARRSNRRAILNWAAGVTLIWGLTATIWLPYLDSRRTYEAVARGHRATRAAATAACVERATSAMPQRALFHYFSGIVTVRDESPRAAGLRARCSCSTAGWRTARRRCPATRSRGRVAGAATTTSGSCSTGRRSAARREVRRRSGDRGASPATAATAPRRSGARSTCRAAAPTAATAGAAAASSPSPTATSTR